MDNRTDLNKVFWTSAIIVSILLVFRAAFPRIFAKGAKAAFSFTTYSFGWFYLAAMFFFYLNERVFTYHYRRIERVCIK
ncbi:MAG: hypothetical protein ACQEWI_14395 [Bacillota bacterium]